MVGLLLPLLLASVVGALWARSLGGLRRLHVRWWPLAVGSIAVELVLYNPPVDRQPWALAWGPWIWVVCLVGMLAVLVRNALGVQAERHAWRLAAVGVATNLFVVLANGGYMPQLPEARQAVGGAPLAVPGAAPQLRNVTPSGPDTRFIWLSDVIAEPAWLPRANVLSVGDLVLSMALAWWAFQIITSQRRNSHVAPVR